MQEWPWSIGQRKKTRTEWDSPWEETELITLATVAHQHPTSSMLRVKLLINSIINTSHKIHDHRHQGFLSQYAHAKIWVHATHVGRPPRRFHWWIQTPREGHKGWIHQVEIYKGMYEQSQSGKLVKELLEKDLMKRATCKVDPYPDSGSTTGTQSLAAS